MPPKLLVVDDEVGMTKVISLVARQLGLDCEVVTDSTLATERCAAFRPDILLVDMIMPGKDGIAVLNEILASGAMPKIVVTSGYGDTYLRLAKGVARFHDCDAIHILRKPFRRTELMDLLTELIKPAAPASPAPRSVERSPAQEVVTPPGCC